MNTESSTRALAGFVRSPRLLAAVAGAVLGVLALFVTSLASRTAPVEPPAPTPPPSRESDRLPDDEPTVDAAASIERARQALGEGRAPEAIDAFEIAFAASPELRQMYAEAYAVALTTEGKRLFEEGSDEAGRRFEAAVAAAPNAFEPHFYLAKVYMRRFDTEGAIREYSEAIRVNPESADAQFNLGYLYFSQRRYEDALRLYERALELEPAYLDEVFYNMSACYERLGRKDEALATLRRGLAARPQSDLLKQRLKQLGG